MIKLYNELLNKAFNGALSEREAQTLKALDELIDTEEKHDEGLQDLADYSWAFGPNTKEMLDGAEANIKAMGQSLVEFRGTPEGDFLNRQAVDPIQVIGGLDSKSALLDAMASDNPIEKAAGYYNATGYVPDDVMAKYTEAVKPIENLSEALSEVENILADVPAEKPEGWSDKDWATLRYGPSYPIPEGEGPSDYARVAGKWILSLGLPLGGTALGIYTGQPLLGTAAGAAIAPPMPINETLELMDEETRSVFTAILANNAYIATLAGISVGAEKKNLKAIDDISKTAVAKEIAEAGTEAAETGAKGGLINRLKGNNMLNFIKKTANFAMKRWKGLTAVSIIGSAIWSVNFGEGANQDPVTEEQVVLPATELSEEETTEETTEETEEETNFDGGSEDEAAGLMGKDEFSRLYGWSDLGDKTDPTTTIPKAQQLGDGVFQGFDYSGNIYEGQQNYVGPGEWNYTPQFLPPGSTINNKAMQEIQVGGTRMTMMAFIGLTASNYNIPPEILYGMIEHETGGTWDPTKASTVPGEDSLGLAQINMAWFGEGTENPEGHIPEGHEFISRELASDPRYAITFLAHNVRRIADNYGGNIMAGVIGHRGGGKAARHYVNNNEFLSKMDKEYVEAVTGHASTLGFFDSKEQFDFGGVGTKREWDPYNATPQEGVNLFIDDMVETMLGVKASQEDYDYWTPKYHDAHRNVYEGTQLALDKGARYEGKSVTQKMDEQMEETGEYKFADEKKNYQTVQDWFTNNVMGAFDI